MGQYKILCIAGGSWRTKNDLYALYDITTNKYALFAELYRFRNSLSCLAIYQIGVNARYKGFNLPVKFYSWLIKNKNITLMSGESQSIGGRSIWERLAKVSGIFIFGYNVWSKKTFQIDQNDLFNEEVYDAELRKDLEDLEEEFNFNYEELANCDNPKERIDLKKKCDINRDKIIKLRKDINIVIGSVRLVAVKKTGKIGA